MFTTLGQLENLVLACFLQRRQLFHGQSHRLVSC